MELMKLTALELGAAIRRGEVSIREATQAALDEIAARDGELNSYITTTPQQALERADQLQKGLGEGVGPLYGVPMAFKDNICTRGVKTTCASKILGDFAPPYNATVVEKLEGAGAVSLGKLNMDEFAMGSTSETSFYGPVRNPWDRERVPGGSSGGAAAAVAAGLGWYAMGSDTGGSIRQPAAYCGVTGVKPTYGTVSRYGLIAYASSLDQIGPLGRDAADCAAILDVIQGRDRRDSTSLEGDYGSLLAGLTGDVKGLRIGIPADCYPQGLDEEIRDKVLEVAQVLRGGGAELVEVPLPVMEYVVPAYYIIASAEASSNLSRFDGVKYGWRAQGYESLEQLHQMTRTQGFGSEVKRRILLGTFALSTGYYDAYYKKALQVKAVVNDTFRRAFEVCDCILTPVSPTTAPRLGESLKDPLAMYLSDLYTVPANLAGLPGVSIPCGRDKGGMPIGAQLIGPHFGEGVLLNAAYAYQQDTNHHKEMPEGGEGK